MSKKWLIPAIAGIALMASACGNNAAPNYTNPNNTTTTQQAGRSFGADGMNVRNYGTGYTGTAFDGIGYSRTRDGIRGSDYNGYSGYSGTGYGFGRFDGTAGTNNNGTYNGFANGARPFHAFTDGRTGSAYNRGLNNASIYQNQGPTRTGMVTMQSGMARLGYAQADRNQIRTNGLDHVYVDRDALAQAVSNVTASCPGVQRSTVLVTDEEVFVGLQSMGNDGNRVKQQARQNAMSICPRYYKVYVTDDANDIQEMIRIASRSSNVSSARDNGINVDSLIKRMGGKTEREEYHASKAASKTRK